MLKLTVQTDCDNAPKKAFLRDFLVAFAEANMEFVLACVSDDIIWEVVGDARIVGKAAFQLALQRPNPVKTIELTLEQIIIDGREAVVSGSFVLANGDAFAFCDVYIFSSASGNAIQSIKSFNIKLG